MATLFNTKISATYEGLFKTIDNAAITASLKELTDGSGNQSGLYVNNAGDFKVSNILEWGSLKDTGTGVTITRYVTSTDGIENFDNNTSLPTSAAVKLYVDSKFATSDTLEEVLSFGNTTGANNIVIQKSIQLPTTTTNSGTPTDVGVISFGGTFSNGNRIFNDSSGGNLRIQGTDNLSLFAPNHKISNVNGSLIIAGDTGVKLYYQNSEKLITTATGVTITGRLSGLTNPTLAQDATTKSYVDALDAGSDLDITDGTTAGAVNLNTQSLSILGTTNEIDSVVSGQSVTIGLPSSISTNLVGDVTGNVTGNVTGDLTGTASLIDVNNTATNQNQYLLQSAGTLGSQTVFADSNLYFNPVTNLLTVEGSGSFTGDLNVTGNITGGGGSFLPLAGGTMTGNTIHNDNVKSIYGTGSDLEIYHSGSDSYIKDSGTGDVRIVASATKIFDADQSHVQATFADGGSVDLYYSGNKKLATTSTGISVTGNGVFTGNVYIETNNRLVLGNSSEVQLFYDGTDGRFLNTTGDLRIDQSAVTQSIVFRVSDANALDTTALTISRNADASFGRDVTIAGDLTVNGTTTTVNSQTLAVVDPLIQLAKDNTANSLDIGLYGDYNDGTDRFLGLFSDASDSNKFKLFKGTTVEPTTTVNIGGSGYVAADLVLANLEAESDIVVKGIFNLWGNNSALAGQIQANSSGGGLYLNASGTNQNIRLVPSGSGIVQSTGSFDVLGSISNSTSLSVGTTGTFGGNVTLSSGSLNVIGANSVNTTGRFESGASSTVSYLQLLPNGATDANSGYIGYDTSNLLKFYTKNTLALSLDASQNATFAGDVNIGNGVTAEKRLVIDCSNPVFALKETDQSADSRVWGMQSITSKLYFRAFNDAFTAATDVMVLDRSGNVGIGTDSPQQLLHINNTSGDFGAEAVLRGSTSTGTPKSEIAFKRASSADGAEMVLRTSNSSGTIQDVMTLDTSGNVGIAWSSPSDFTSVNADNLVVGSGTGSNGITVFSATNAYGGLAFADGTGTNDQWKGLIQYAHLDDSMRLFTANTERMRIDSSGNVGINGASNFGSDNKAIQLINGVYSGAFQIDSVGNVGLTQNAYQDGIWKYYQTNEAAILNLEDGQFKFFNAASGTAGTAITFSERMRIDSDGYTKFTKSTGGVVASFYDGTYGVDLAATATGGSIQTFNTNQTLNLNTYGTGDITFTTSGTSERMRIDSDGNVGIGTDSPDAKLHSSVGASGASVWLPSNTPMVLESSGTNALNFLSPNTGEAYIMFSRPSNTTAGYMFYNHATDIFSFSRPLSVTGNNLDVKGSNAGNTSVRITDSTGTVGTDSLDLINDGTAAYIWNRASTPILFGTAGTERMRITSGGAISLANANTSVIGRPYSSGTINNGQSVVVNLNSAGGNQAGGFLVISAVPNNTNAGGAVEIWTHIHTQGANVYSKLSGQEENNITIGESGGAFTISNSSGSTVYYNVKVLNLTDFASTIAGT